MGRDKLIKVKQRIFGNQIGEGFGSSVSAPDFNHDDLSDLAVGAPMHSVDHLYDVGCVYVFINVKVRLFNEFKNHLCQVYGV